ncbi:hypothetical protein F5Y19DRAFT_418235 [Xylariaceae sp. FL1651]|nr:hypothetical protein F5Y19DRAFT_418235 [Xylariaceae sp. FL1651]
MKLGDQTKNSACSKSYYNSCHGRLQDTKGDANCRLVVVAGSGCDPNEGIIAEIPYVGYEVTFVGPEHSHIVIC